MAANRRIVGTAEGRLAAASVVAGYTTLKDVAAAGGRAVLISIASNLDGDVTISLDGGTTDYISLSAGISHAITLGAAGAEYSGVISVKRGPSGASTTGFISCGVIRLN